MSDGKVPVVWSAGGKFDLMKMYHNYADADVGEYGLGMDGIPETTSEDQAEEIPWAARHLKCSTERPDLCKHPYKYCATCWIPRKDHIAPTQKQNDPFKGQVSWHPGWRSHQLTGRVLAFSLLQALKEVIRLIRDEGNELISVDMESYYGNIRRKMKSLDPSLGLCYRINSTLPERLCRVSMKGRTQYTPRAYPEQTSITSIIKPEPVDGYVPKNKLKPLYDGPHAHNPCFDLPEGAVDVVARILGNTTSATGDRVLSEMDREPYSLVEQVDENRMPMRRFMNEELDEDTIVPGRGWQVFGEPQGFCDGTYDVICARSTRNRCVLSSHHDERGDVVGSEMAGWIVLEIPREEVKEGIIVVKLHTWHERHDNTRTMDWKTINNMPEDNSAKSGTPDESSLSGSIEDPSQRRLRRQKYETPELPQLFRFEYAIDGEMTSLNRTEFLDRKQDIQRVVEALTLLDDPNFATSPASKTSNRSSVEVAIRLRNSFQRLVFGISHIYWA